ncbi:hypothetical protein DDF62_21875 [Caulobacter radicis]|nr:hypothetical protein DDF62_21875 [Caulobacter radicis]
MALLLALALSTAFVAPREVELFHESVLAEIGHHERLRSRSVEVEWYRAAGGDRSRLHVADFKCDQPVGRRTCQFTLIRDGGPVELRGETVADRLSCSARFQRNLRGGSPAWLVERRLRVPRGSFTGTTLRCEAP